MADNVPVSFPIPGESAIVSYSYTDILEGTGVVVFNGASMVLNASPPGTSNANPVYLLTTQQPYSSTISTGATIPDTSWNKVVDIDFDVVFNMPKTIKGNAFVTCTIGGGNGSSGANGFYYAKLRKYDGSTETEIASAASECFQMNGSTYSGKVTLTKIVVPLTHFKKGETLRLTIELWGAKVAAGTQNFYIGHDPQDRTFSNLGVDADGNPNPTTLKFYCPFKLEL